MQTSIHISTKDELAIAKQFILMMDQKNLSGTEITIKLPLHINTMKAITKIFEQLEDIYVSPEKGETKTSSEWEKFINANYGKLHVLDPDGWDRKNFDYSWYEEQITIEEFMYRLGSSTIQADLSILNLCHFG